MKSSPLSRLSLLLTLAGSSVLASWALASPSLRYTITLRPARALLGDSIVATLVCTATAPSEAVTFEDASLMLVLRRSPPVSEAAIAFPNRRSADREGVHVRIAPVDRRRLAGGKRLEREFDLVEIYPRQTLDTGDFMLSYDIGAKSPWHAGPTRLTIESGPDAVPALFKRLEDSDPGVRARSAGLLHRMTGNIVGYAPDGEVRERTEAIARWRLWWDVTGRKLPWNFESDGATFGPHAGVPPPHRRSHKLGGVAYPRRSLGPAARAAMSSALAEWQRSAVANPSTLRGRVWIADRVLAYPGQGIALDPGGDVAGKLEAALSRLSALVRSSTPEATGAMLILATVARCPDPRFVASLSTLQSSMRGSSAWRQAAYIVDGLLDLLDPGRTPTGD